MTLEQAIEFIGDDELVEIALENIRIRHKSQLEHDSKKPVRAASA